jgi:hypothetical protein
MSPAYVIVHIADDGALTVFGSAYAGTLDHAQADAIARRVGKDLGGHVHVRQIVPF